MDLCLPRARIGIRRAHILLHQPQASEHSFWHGTHASGNLTLHYSIQKNELPFLPGLLLFKEIQKKPKAIGDMAAVLAALSQNCRILLK